MQHAARLWRTHSLALLLVLGMPVAAFSLSYTASSRAIAACYRAPENLRNHCYNDVVQRAFATHGLDEAMQTVTDIAASDGSFAQDCHSNMHELGKFAYSLYATGHRLDVTVRAANCNYGFYHGFMEEMFHQQGSIAGASAFCEQVATELGGDVGSLRNCYHGIGHGTTDGYDPRTWGDAAAMVAPGLKICREATTDEQNLSSCELGAFNSIELMYADPKYKLDTHGNPFSLCEQHFDALEKNACYIEMSVLAVQMADGDFARALAFAQRVPQGDRALAVTYVSTYEFSSAKNTDPIQNLQRCRKTAHEYVPQCVLGTVQGLVVYGAPGRVADAATAFCTDPALTNDEQTSCAHWLLIREGITAAEKTASCNAFEGRVRVPDCQKK